MANNNTNSSRSGRGFAGMDPEQQKEIASKGGKAAHQKGTAHEFNSEEAAKAGALGGKASHSSSKNDSGDMENKQSSFKEEGILADED